MKLLSLMRINNNISFIVSMLYTVGKGLVPFISLFTGFIVLFSFIMMTLQLDLGDGERNPYEGIGHVGYIIFIIRTSLGDFDVENFQDLPSKSRTMIWVFWMMVCTANTLIFLNFLIAVISDVFE